MGRLETNGWDAATVGSATLEAAGSLDELQTRLMLGLRTDWGVARSELDVPGQVYRDRDMYIYIYIYIYIY